MLDGSVPYVMTQNQIFGYYESFESGVAPSPTHRVVLSEFLSSLENLVLFSPQYLTVIGEVLLQYPT
jgi:hypothetical protein